MEQQSAGFSLLGFWVEGRLIDAVRVPRRIRMQTVWIVVPLAVQTIACKLVALQVLARAGLRNGVYDLIDPAAMAPLWFVLAVSLFAAVIWVVRKPTFPLSSVLVFSLCSAGLAGLLAFTLPAASSGLFTRVLFVLRGELLFFLSTYVVLGLVLHNLPAAPRRRVRWLLWLVAAAASVLVGMDLLVLAETGTPPTAASLFERFEVTTLQSAGALLLFVVPLLYVLGPVVADRFPLADAEARSGFLPVLLLILLIFMWPVRSPAPDYEVLARATLVRLALGAGQVSAASRVPVSSRGEGFRADDEARIEGFSGGTRAEEGEVVAYRVVRAEPAAGLGQFDHGAPVVLSPGEQAQRPGLASDVYVEGQHEPGRPDTGP